MYTRESIAALYEDKYAEVYDELYVKPWPEKYQVNLQLLQLLLRELPQQGRWLDLCCGQAWHFSHVGCSLQKIGVDLSESQLRRAAVNDPTASFICADVAEVSCAPASVTLVTSFWGAYCYLDDDDAIIALLDKAISWIEVGGAMYLEILPPENLVSFNTSPYAQRTGFRVSARTPDYRAWLYQDCAGVHLMRSPALSEFVLRFRHSFEHVNCIQTGFMVNLVGRNRRAPCGLPSGSQPSAQNQSGTGIRSEAS